MNVKTIVLAVALSLAVTCIAQLPAQAHVVRIEFQNDSTVCAHVNAYAWAVTQTKPLGFGADVKPGGRMTFTQDMVFTGSHSGGGTPPPVGTGVHMLVYGSTNCSGTILERLHTSRALNSKKVEAPFKLTGRPGSFHLQ